MGPPALYVLHLWMPVLMAAGLVASLHQALPQLLVAPSGLAMLMLGVFIVYTGDRVLERSWGLGRALLPLASSAILACGLLGAVALRRRDTLPVLLDLALVSLGYPLIKRWPLPRLASVAGAWTLACLRLPFWTGGARLPPWALACGPAALSVACAIAAGTILCDLKDRDGDAASGVRTLTVLYGARGACAWAAAIAAVGVGAALWSHAPAILCCNVGMVLAAARPDAVQRPVSGPLLVDAALAAPGLGLLVSHAAERWLAGSHHILASF
jgi:4-hydroxybenzoate polyprenyltransferase